MLQLEGENYLIRSDNTEFSDRQRSIFDQLDAIKVKNHKKNIVHKAKAKKSSKTKHLKKLSTDVVVDGKERKINTKHFKGKESIFKRPENPAPRKVGNRVPDFQRNPHKWKKYSLSDVSEDDMSDKSNTAAALAFLNEMKSRKSPEEEPMDIDEKIIFKKPLRKKSGSSGSGVVQVSNDDSPGEDGTSYFRGTKLVMPEYVVGEKKKPDRSKKIDSASDEKTSKVAEVKLNHLTDYDDGDDDLSE